MQKFIQYLKDVKTELAKVSWPTRNEVSGATLLVVVLSIAMSVFVFACDKIILLLISLILKNNM